MGLVLASMAVATAASAAPVEIELARLKRREPMAWSLLFEREYPIVFRVVLGRVREPVVAEDIAAQVFLEAMEGIGRYRDRGRPITAWLLTIARHRSLDWFRKARREQGTEVEPVGEGPDSGLTVALDALASLTDEQREVVHLRFVEGYALEEVARMMAGAPVQSSHCNTGRWPD